MFVNAFEEVFKKATVPVNVEGSKLQFRVATLSAIILLKLIAYDDRPEKRTQDPLDIADGSIPFSSAFLMKENSTCLK